MKIQYKILTFVAFIIGMFLISQFFDFKLTGNIIVNSELLDSGSSAGQYSTIALDSNGKIHITYSTGIIELKYCNNTAGSWSCTVIEKDGFYSSIVIDSNDKVHVSQNNLSGGDLRYCNNTASDGSWSCVNIETTDNVGAYSSMAIDLNDKLHIAHYDSTNDDLRYCNNTASDGSWSCTTVDTVNDVGDFSSIAIDLNNKAHISYRDVTNNDLKYCNNTASNGAWSCTTLDSVNNVGSYTSIAIDTSDKVHISYRDYTNNNLKYCNNTATDGSWSCTTVDSSSSNVGQWTSIAIDSNDKIHIGYSDNTNKDLKYCNNVDGSWVCEKLADEANVNLNLAPNRALAIKRGRLINSTSFSGKVHISWFNNSLIYTSVDPFFPNIQFVSLTTSTGNYSRNYIEANVTANDTDALDTITIYLYNSTRDEINSSSSSTSPLFFNVTSLSDGTYYLNATANDTVNNLNQTETRKIILDTTNPVASPSCSPSTINTGASFPCSCSGSDAISGVSTSVGSSTSGSTSDTSQKGTFTYTCTITDNTGNTASATATYTVKSSSVSLEDSSTQIIQQSYSYSEITPESGITITNFDGDIGINEIKIEVKEQASNIKVTVKKYSDKPEDVSTGVSGRVYKYLQIETENLGDKLEKVIIKIQVEKSWTSENNLEKDQIAMFKFDNLSEEWNELTTIFSDEDDDFYFYEVELDSFSFFAISGKIVTEEVGGEITEEIEEKKDLGELWLILIGILIIVSVIIFINYLIKKKREEVLDEDLEKQEPSSVDESGEMREELDDLDSIKKS